MNSFSPWNVDASQILTHRDLALILAVLITRKDRLANVHMNLALVRLACCCGLRANLGRPGACHFGGMALRIMIWLPGRLSEKGRRLAAVTNLLARCGKPLWASASIGMFFAGASFLLVAFWGAHAFEL
jgi:hypothetical protein